MSHSAVRQYSVPPSTGGSKLPSLTGLRFVAALLVFLYHTSQFMSPVPPHLPVTPFADPGWSQAWAKVLGAGGFVGVSFFFVLSGFVLTWSTRPGDGAWSFLRRRLLKIYPMHVVTWAVAMVLFAAAFTPVSSWLPNLLLLHSFSSNPAVSISVNPPSWSLSCELLFYVLFPLLIVPLRRISDSRLWAAATAVVLGAVGVVLITLYVVPDLPKGPFIPDLSMQQFWFGYFFPPARLFEFALGMVLARIVMAGRWPRFGMLPAAVLAVASYALALYVPTAFAFSLVTLVPLGLLIAATAQADLTGRRTPFGGRTMRWLGDISFGFYMAQGIVLYHGRLLFGDSAQYDTPVAIAVLLAFTAANLLAGWLLFVAVERPVMRKWGRRRSRTTDGGDRPATVAPAPVPGNPAPQL
ncbi:acyltransferase [Micromonospora sp. WMMD882]|uniref:acyltransferase family protein n=1 Tax=Micromonospora sp. WMMD882 TaxID=3015151 RepID=UPI00248CC700|nr:acyltransferase [Micromonospora sp. WMMD882]WBB78684.1 acyltransferase [Micromonospora sp. WMMD882]